LSEGHPIGAMTNQTTVVQSTSRAAIGASGNGRRACLAAVFLASLVYFVGLQLYARVRPIDADEGFYATAARLVWQGKAPYRDFFYQQAPLLPYLYGWIWGVHPRSLIAMRTFSVFCGALAVLLWGLAFVFSGRLTLKVAFAAFLAIALNPYWVSWHSVVKVYAVSNLLMTVASIVLYAALRTEKWRWYLAGGLALGLCASVRSFYGPLIPGVLLWCVYTKRREQKSYWPAFSFLAGSLAGTSPMIWSFANDPRPFVFNNIRYHGLDAGFMWLNGEPVEGYRSLGHIALVYVADIVVRLIGQHPYFTVSAILTIAGMASIWRLRRTAKSPYSAEDDKFFQLDFLLLVIYVVVALIPFPPFDQYFVSPLVPLTAPFLAEGIRISLSSGKKISLALALGAPLLFLTDVGREAKINSGGPFWTVSSYEAVSKIVDQRARRDGIVLSFWPGYVFESGREYVPGFEDQFVYRVINKTTPEEKLLYHIPSEQQVLGTISRRDPDVVVIHPWIAEYYLSLSETEKGQFQQALRDNYTLVSRIDDVEVYGRVPKPAPADPSKAQ
jgi:hypothetical protein